MVKLYMYTILETSIVLETDKIFVWWKNTFFDQPSDKTCIYQSTDQILYIHEKYYTCYQLISFDQNLYSSEQ